MSTPTLEQIQSWPVPNFVDPETRVNLLLGIEAPLTILTIMFVSARFYSRTCLRKVLGWDDWIMALAAVFAVAITLSRTLWAVRLPMQQKIGLVFVFSVGVIVCITGVVRLWYLTYYFKHYDLFYNGAICFILAGLETNLAMICGSLPGCKPLLARFCPTIFGTQHHAASDYANLRYSKFILPGARMSIRLSRGAPVHVPPASRLHNLDRSVAEMKPKPPDGNQLSRTVSVESVPVKLDKRPFPPDYAVLSPLQEVYSPAVTERMLVHGQNSVSPRSATFSESYSRRGSVVYTTHELRRESTNGSDAPLWRGPRTPLTPFHISSNLVSPTVSERMEDRGAKSWYNEREDSL
ncbi:hypothetical protein FKW77_009012 [Venturia effusa]|uniref:Rhodopsin domain-containing protein n=1 Tax=Venturia effusa TaxID=50376 RepID=A0A517L1W6_9PEZI|nr:hypothetical protein FKW77_009012 [Venturia effusa]